MTTNPEVLLAYARARQKTVSARAEAALARLGGETLEVPTKRLAKRT
jgi:hypothetical protein